MMLRYLADYFYVNLFLLNIQEDKIYAIYPEEHFNIFKMNIFLAFSNDVFEPVIYNNLKLWNHETEPFKKLINVDKSSIGVLNMDFSNNVLKEAKLFKTGTEDLDRYLPESYIKKMEELEKNLDSKDSVHLNESENKFEEVEDFDENNEEVVHDDVTETELDVLIIKNDNDVFCTKANINDTISDKKKKKKKSKKLPDLSNVSMKMKLTELQKLAKKCGIKLTKGKTKSGKPKMKTKSSLVKDLKLLN
jgi:hypothetical protein